MKRLDTQHHTPKQHPLLFRRFPETNDRYRTVFPPYWSPYKSAKEKLRYHRLLPEMIQPFIRSYCEKLQPDIAKLQLEDALTYLSNAREAWRKHIVANEAVDCFLTYEFGSVFGDWSPVEWRMARRLLVAAMVTDHAKALYSGGMKGKLDMETERLTAKYRHIEPDFTTHLLTPSFITFYEARDHDHKRYLLSVLQGHPDSKLKEQLLEQYHAGDERLLDLRLGSFVLPTAPVGSLFQEIATREVAFRERAIRKRYLMLERPELATFEAMLIFDNNTEYEYTYSLRGLPDLFLREEILRRLIDANLFQSDTAVFGLTLEAFTSAIDMQIDKLRRHFTIRLRPYRQNYDTCGTACIMSILNRKGVPLDEETELRIWQLVGKPFNFPGGLAWVLLRNGFQVSYWQDTPELLNSDNPEFARMDEGLLHAAREYVDLHGKAVDAGLHFKVADWGFVDVREQIERGNLCLLYLYVSDTITHVVIARGLRNNRLEIIDPLGHIKFLSEHELNSLIVHPMGKRMLVVKKLPDDLMTALESRLASIGF